MPSPAAPLAGAASPASPPPFQHRQRRGRPPARRGWWWQRLLRVTTRLFKPAQKRKDRGGAERGGGGGGRGGRGEHRDQRKRNRQNSKVWPCDVLDEQCQARRLFVAYTRQHVEEKDAPPLLAVAGGGSPTRLCSLHRFLVEVSGPAGEPLASAFGEGGTTSQARNAAAALALTALGAADAVQELPLEKARAWLGDAVLTTLVGVLGLQAGLSAFEMHGLNQKLFSNDALSALSPQKLVTSYATATAMEGSVGGAVDLAAVAPLLRQAVESASPQLLAAIETAVAAKAATAEGCRRRAEEAAAAEERRRAAEAATLVE